MHTLHINNVPLPLCGVVVHMYNLYNGENEVGPDSRHVLYLIILVIKNKC